MQPLSLQAVSPEFQFRESRRLVPSSQGLLATADTNHTIHSAPVLPPSNDSVQNDPAPQGLKLLQLQRPPLPQQRAPHYLPAQVPQTLCTANPAAIESNMHNLKNNDLSASKKTEEEKTNWSSFPKRQLSFHTSHDPTPGNCQPKIQTSERSREQGFSLLPPALPVHTPAPMQGLRLLHFQPVPHSNITFPKLPIPASSRPATVIAGLMGEAPMIKLLHLESGPKMARNISNTSRFLN